MLAWLPVALAAPCEALPELLPGVPNAPPTAPCGTVELDLAGRAANTWPQVGLYRTLELPRAQAELGMRGAGPASARLRVEAVRSGGDTGYIGIAGESIVPRVLVVEARVDLSRLNAALAAGLVDDLWATQGQEGWALAALAPAFALESGWMERSDLGLWAAWSAPRELATLAVSATTGEGLARRERNNGQDLTAVLLLRPTALAQQPPAQVELGLMGREGSRGLGTTRDHRVGARATVHTPQASAGAELLRAWGVAGDGRQTPWGGSAWARSGPELPLVAYGRVDLTHTDPGAEDALALRWRLGAGPALSPTRPGGAPGLHLVLGYEGAAWQDQAAPLAGASEAFTEHTVFVQLSARARAALPLSPF